GWWCGGRRAEKGGAGGGGGTARDGGWGGGSRAGPRAGAPSPVYAQRLTPARPRHTAVTLLPGCSKGRIRDEAPPRTRPRWRPCSRVKSSTMAEDSPCRRTPSTMPSSVHSMGLTYIRFILGNEHRWCYRVSVRSCDQPCAPSICPSMVLTIVHFIAMLLASMFCVLTGVVVTSIWTRWRGGPSPQGFDWRQYALAGLRFWGGIFFVIY